ncbi:hypothetical protein EDD18DRAFT_1367607 [Armillaria luteobubalina]|uniref:Uncharacterized protein n=1 Tax=Armillaria luteobubalina TaxID=153913 RepID=A0AA39NZS0_9AGAR|nr:hypothetical protein EDD18DRAFT_1367607 [Armillaria luteobubalina]
MASLGYVDKHSDEVGKQSVALLDLVGPNSQYGFDYKPWSGREAIPIANDEGRVIAVLVGQPKDPDWESIHTSASALLDQSQVGISFGGGQQCVVPPSLKPSLKRMCPQFLQNLHHEGTVAQVLATLINHIAFIHLAGFASGIFTARSLSLFQCYAMHLRALLLSNDNLILNFANSIFSASTFNFGPKSVTIEHTDSGNLLFGWCTIPVLSWFNSKKGVHLILWDLKLVIEFPPGSTVLIPSTVLRHSNTTVDHGEMRYPFMQYMAGGLFRWVDDGFQLSEDYWRQLNSVERDAALRARAG